MAAVVIATTGMLTAPARAASSDFDLARYHGKVVVVDFWASWCKPCRESIPWLNAMHSRYGAGGLVVIGVNVDAERADAERFLRQVPIDFGIVFDPQGEIAQRYKVAGMPTTLIFDRAGKLVQSRIGFRAARKVEEETALQKLLSTKTE